MLDRSYFSKLPEKLVDDKEWLVVCEPNPEETELLVSMGMDPSTVSVVHKGPVHCLILRRRVDATVKLLQEITKS